MSPQEYAAQACLEYERWAQEVTRLTREIAKCVCPQEALPEAETYFDGHPSCFQEAKEEEIDGGWLPPESRQRTLDEIEEEVADCPSCTRLVDLIRERKHARVRYGVAKRKVRHAGKRMMAEDQS